MFTDTRIENDVRDVLRRDPRIKHPELIAVSVDEIGTVVLRGTVHNPFQRRVAADDARSIEGVFEVIVDDLSVHRPIGHRRADDQILAAAVGELTRDARIRSTHIHVKVSHGEVTLSGYVRSESESTAAVQDVASLGGVAAVTNQIEVR